MSTFLQEPLGEFLLWLLTVKMGAVVLFLLAACIILLVYTQVRDIINPDVNEEEMVDLLKEIRNNTAGSYKGDAQMPSRAIDNPDPSAK